MRTALLAAALLCSLPASAQTTGSTSPEADPLSEADVREFVRLRLIEHEVVSQAEADLGPLDNDENGPVARQRLEARLAPEGWTYEAYRARDERIQNAVGAMVLDRGLAESNAELEGALAEAAAFMTPEQLAEARSALAQHDAETQAAIDETRPDWPAIERYLDTLEHLDDFTAGVRPDPPVLSASGE